MIQLTSIPRSGWAGSRKSGRLGCSKLNKGNGGISSDGEIGSIIHGKCFSC